MQVTLKRLPKSRVALTISVDPERMSDFFTAAFEEIGQQVEIEGFRKGKAPKLLILERVGHDRVRSLALEKALPRTYHEAILDQKLVPVGEPAVHVEKVSEENGLAYRAEVDVLPMVEPGRYQKIRLNPKKFAPKPVNPQEIEEAINRLVRAAAEPKDVDRPAADGDLVEATYAGKVRGVVQEGLTSRNHPIVLGQKSVLPDFEAQLVGMNHGETKTFSLEVPSRSGEKQTVEFEVKAERVAELVAPPFDDVLAKKFGKPSAADIRAELTGQFAKDRERDARFALEQAVVDAVTKQARLELPETLIEREITHRLEQLAEQLKRGGQTLETFVAGQKKSLEGFRKELRPSAEAAVKTSLVLREIAEREDIKAEKNETGEAVFKKVLDWLVEQATK